MYLLYDDRIGRHTKFKIYSQRFRYRHDFKCKKLFKIIYLAVMLHCHSHVNEIKYTQSEIWWPMKLIEFSYFWSEFELKLLTTFF